MESVMQTESEEVIKEGWMYCEICEYKFKKKNTIKKDMRTMHSQCISCEKCGIFFTIEYSLCTHKQNGERK